MDARAWALTRASFRRWRSTPRDSTFASFAPRLKSIITIRPSRTIMFDVVRSPWMIPARCKRPTIRPTSLAVFSAAGPPPSRTLFTVGPSTNSMTILFSTRSMSYRIGTATPAARASAIRRASIRIRDRRNSSSRAAIRYDFGTRNFSTAARPMNSVRRSSASAPRLMSIARRCGGPGKNLLRNAGAPGRRREKPARLQCWRGTGLRREIGWETPGVPRLEDPAFQEDNRRAVPLAPDRTTRGLQDLVHRGVDVRVVVALLESELAGVIVFQRLDLDVRGAEGQAHHDDHGEQVVLVVDALAQGPALNAEEEGPAVRPRQAQRVERPVPVGFRPRGLLHEDRLLEAVRPNPLQSLGEQFVGWKECRHIAAPGWAGRGGECRPTCPAVGRRNPGRTGATWARSYPRHPLPRTRPSRRSAYTQGPRRGLSESRPPRGRGTLFSGRSAPIAGRGGSVPWPSPRRRVGATPRRRSTGLPSRPSGGLARRGPRRDGPGFVPGGCGPHPRPR